MTSTDLEPVAHGVSLFPGATPDAVISAATDVATQFSDVVRKQKMLTRIGDNDHVNIEAWQTIGALTGVVASRGLVTELPWPHLNPLSDPPAVPPREPRNTDSPEWREWKLADRLRAVWELHAQLHDAYGIGKAYGYKAEFFATKNGMDVGWGESSCTRAEASKVTQEDYAIRSMAQTRAQSRALGAPLKFVVKLAGYETTPAEEADGSGAAPSAPPEALPWGKVIEDSDQLEAAAKTVRGIAPEIDAEKFLLDMGSYFNGVPEANLKMLRALHRRIGRP
jgi:hypothetical protein